MDADDHPGAENRAYHLYWVVHARSRDDADIVAAERDITIVATTTLRMAERIAWGHNVRLARQHTITPARFPRDLERGQPDRSLSLRPRRAGRDLLLITDFAGS